MSRLSGTQMPYAEKSTAWQKAGNHPRPERERIHPTVHKQLYERLRSKILAGQLEAGTRLPSTRVLASGLLYLVAHPVG